MYNIYSKNRNNFFKKRKELLQKRKEILRKKIISIFCTKNIVSTGTKQQLNLTTLQELSEHFTSIQEKKCTVYLSCVTFW